MSFETLLRQLEERLLDPEVRKNGEQIRELLDADFREFGSSGRVFDREGIVSALATQASSCIEITEFQTKFLAEDVALVTYVAIARGDSERPEVGSLRSSVWVFREGKWRMIFHQGSTIARP